MADEKVKSKIGLESSFFFPIAAEPTGARPTYGEKLDLGAAVRANISINYAEGQLYGDDALQMDVKSFSGGTLDSETLLDDLTIDVAVFGATQSESGEVIDHKDDAAPPGGFAFIQKLMNKSKKIFYRAVFLLRVTGNQTADNAETRGSGITFANKTINYSISACDSGEWRLREEFDSKEDALAWINEKAAAAT